MSNNGNRLQRFASIAIQEFNQILKQPPTILDDRLRIFLNDGSILDVQYPLQKKYSFHWMKGDLIYRINTATHHSEISTFPRHIHFQTETNVIPDNITSFDSSQRRIFKEFCNG